MLGIVVRGSHVCRLQNIPYYQSDHFHNDLNDATSFFLFGEIEPSKHTF